MNPYLHTGAAVFSGVFAALTVAFGGGLLYDLWGLLSSPPIEPWPPLWAYFVQAAAAFVGFFVATLLAHWLAGRRQRREHDRQDADARLRSRSVALAIIQALMQVKAASIPFRDHLKSFETTGASTTVPHTMQFAMPQALRLWSERLYLLGDACENAQQFIAVADQYEDMRTSFRKRNAQDLALAAKEHASQMVRLSAAAVEDVLSILDLDK
ncbi:MAG: hypothetical protein HOB82_00380 [Alphaproteobacteria bacterium]|jgi:hypothetical protein|nr:hypothetical protein [Alphaproteobacteria bacterium]MBT4709973.1 hypothetical protein [Alphaproteobacteria bacterium]MBT5859521.1 hypothetical protein [Alphaproteobacteria bacterium]